MTHASAAPVLAHDMHPFLLASAFAGAVGVLLLVYLAVAVISIIAAVKVVTKAGYSGWWVLIGLVPIVGFVMALVFAFSDWPVLRELRALRAELPRSSGGWPPGYRGTAGFPGGPGPAGAGMPGPGAGAGMPGTPGMPGVPPAGWYPTPDGRQRYWDA